MNVLVIGRPTHGTFLVCPVTFSFHGFVTVQDIIQTSGAFVDDIRA